MDNYATPEISNSALLFSDIKKQAKGISALFSRLERVVKEEHYKGRVKADDSNNVALPLIERRLPAREKVFLKLDRLFIPDYELKKNKGVVQPRKMPYGLFRAHVGNGLTEDAVLVHINLLGKTRKVVHKKVKIKKDETQAKVISWKVKAKRRSSSVV